MVFAPAIGVACFQVLAGLCFVVSGLLAVLVMKQSFLPNDGLQIGTMLITAAIFAAGGIGCIWASRFIHRTARGE
jgi:ATP/ADP translocase